MADAEHLDEVLNNLPSALISLDPDNTVVYRNRSAEKLTPQLKPGVNVWDALGPTVNEEKVDRMMRGERVLFRAAPGLPVLEWLISVDHPADGTVILMAWDASITDEIVQGRVTFIMGASHELRSPLTALLGFAEILELESDTLTLRQAEAVAVIRQNAQHLRSMVEDIVDLSRNSFGELRLDIERLDLVPVITGVSETLRPQIKAKGQTLAVSIEPELPAIDADSHRIRQIVLNLLQNAHVHTPAGTTIRIEARPEKDGVMIEVGDDGPGLPFDEADDAFSSFRRGPQNGDSSIAGSGVGLTITRQLAMLHRGWIKVRTAPGEGTNFDVWLPCDRKKARTTIAPVVL